MFRMFALLAHIVLREGGTARFEELARQLAQESVTREAGLRRYEYFRREQPDHFLAVMAFDDYRDFLAHQASEHHHVLAGAMRDLIVEIRLERIDPIPGCSILAPGVEVEVASVGPELSPPSDAELSARTEHYQQRYPLSPMTWWYDSGEGSHAD
jgi:quinol monooxygenase YgiN